MAALDSDLSDCISDLEKSGSVYHIYHTNRREDGKKGNGYMKSRNTLYYNPDNYNTYSGRKRPPIIGLAHELGHMLNDEKGTSVEYDHEKARMGDKIEGEKGNSDERLSIDYENKVRRVLKVEERDYDYYNVDN